MAKTKRTLRVRAEWDVSLNAFILPALVAILIAATIYTGMGISAANAKIDTLNAALANVSGAQAAGSAGAQAGAGAGQQAGTAVKPTADDDAVLGQASAKVTIIEFSDFQCPYCSRFVLQTFPQIKTNYIDTGKAKLIFRDFPLGFHANAAKAAEAAECAGDQGKYYEMHDKLFGNQSALGIDSYKQWAAELGLNTATFNSCLDSGKYTAEVAADAAAGAAAGVTGTPTFFINGAKLVGAQPYEAFQQAIDAALAG
ncbi:MAG: thioredoxin domain-containing protein [Candidatus Aenigmatarchaeota archaeon]